MRWPWLEPSPQDVAGIAFGIVLAVVVTFVLIKFPSFQRNSSNFGFGQDWDCTNIPMGEPVCVKRVGANSNQGTKPPN
jgi:hypothetical protein